MSLKEEFLEIVSQYTPGKAEGMWNELESYYSKKDRFYHNLHHLESLYHELKPIEMQFSNWHTVVFAIVYHDVVYDTKKKNNEEKSANTALERLKRIKFPVDQILRCQNFILATKQHESKNNEIDLFTDADLSILGTSEENYKIYCEQIRKEYYSFENSIYNSGRKKVLDHFLTMPRIFKSEEFFIKYETQARKNLQSEIDVLFSPFKELIDIVHIISEKMEKYKSEPFADKEEYNIIRSQLDAYLTALEKLELEPAAGLSSKFYTGSWLQDTAISYGWGDLFLDLAKRFDKIYEDLKSKTSNPYSKPSLPYPTRPYPDVYPGYELGGFLWHWNDGEYKCTTAVDVYHDYLFWRETRNIRSQKKEVIEKWQPFSEFWKEGPLFGPLAAHNKSKIPADYEDDNKSRWDEVISVRQREEYDYDDGLRQFD